MFDQKNKREKNYMTNKISSILVLGFLMMALTACSFSFSTANLSDLKFGKDKNASSASTSFKPEDEIFAVTAVNNTSGKNKVKFRVLFDKVDGAQTGTVAYKLDKDLEVEESRPVWFNFSLPSGFASGSYKVETVLTNEDGKELDRKAGNFTVIGGSTEKATKTDAKSSEPDESKDSDN
jgi:hypothetical protein